MHHLSAELALLLHRSIAPPQHTPLQPPVLRNELHSNLLIKHNTMFVSSFARKLHPTDRQLVPARSRISQIPGHRQQGGADADPGCGHEP